MKRLRTEEFSEVPSQDAVVSANVDGAEAVDQDDLQLLDECVSDWVEGWRIELGKK